MGHWAGWLTLGAGIAGGADVILILEISYSVNQIAKAIRQCNQRGRNFSIVAIAEGALSRDDAAGFPEARARKSRATSQSALQRRAPSWPAWISNTRGTRCAWRIGWRN
jgi:6-phosphofructokinase